MTDDVRSSRATVASSSSTATPRASQSSLCSSSSSPGEMKPYASLSDREARETTEEGRAGELPTNWS
eukprot:CAMPEP_0182940562 /NCGR_PEP_ID=MMETSP0105_2-20130417/47494_1 /TAXON_ID=81532 ORGANISM="Acanthoeca-like sp., Strain 10tr" /NCGR_SAMPLE_ID=MMETSP0105_2 /ASSEMBLY_ACC=CAM_ASM_000205 /LENGTH=66 /DNA_ID=CAMNT_0025080063 /DNA_START=35 /DNA_END=231 /DNA_ORIENTATION=-